MFTRFFYLIGLVLAVWWLPTWLAWLLALLGIIRYHRFYEVLLPALLFDLLYGASHVSFLALPLGFTALALVLVFLAEELKAVVLLERWPNDIITPSNRTKFF